MTPPLTRENLVNIEEESLTNKVVLEVGSGRGNTTRKLVTLLSKHTGARLIVTDISDMFFSQLQSEFTASKVQIRFIHTSAQELINIPNNSIDYLVCNYTLCAINSRVGSLASAIRRFWEVLKAEGKFFAEEEFPIDRQNTPAQEIWAEKWRILKAAILLSGELPYQEIAPETLKGLCLLSGFENIKWAEHSETFSGADTLDFFRRRLDKILTDIQSERLRAGFLEAAMDLQNRAKQVGSMEVPFYRLVAQKGAG